MQRLKPVPMATTFPPMFLIRTFGRCPKIIEIQSRLTRAKTSHLHKKEESAGTAAQHQSSRSDAHGLACRARLGLGGTQRPMAFHIHPSSLSGTSSIPSCRL